MKEELIWLDEEADYCFLHEAFYYVMLQFIPGNFGIPNICDNFRFLKIDTDEDEGYFTKINNVIKEWERHFEERALGREKQIFEELLDKRIDELKDDEDKEAVLTIFKKNFINPYSSNVFFENPYAEVYPYVKDYLGLSTQGRKEFRKKLWKDCKIKRGRKDEALQDVAKIEKESGKFQRIFTFIKNSFRFLKLNERKISGDSKDNSKDYKINTKLTEMLESPDILMKRVEKREKAQVIFNAIIYEEMLEELKRDALMKLFNFIYEEKVSVYSFVEIPKQCADPYFVMDFKTITHKLTLEDLIRKITERSRDLLVDFRALSACLPSESLQKESSIVTFTNGVQRWVKRDATGEAKINGAMAYGKNAEIRNKAKEISRRILEAVNPEDFTKRTTRKLKEGKKLKNNTTKFSAKQLTNLVGEEIEKNHKKLLIGFAPYEKHKKGDGVAWVQEGLYDWCNSVFKEFRKK